MPLTRDAVARLVGSAFIGGAASRTDLVALARARRAPDNLLGVLRGLPDRRFEHLYEVWDLLSETHRPASAGASAPTVPAAPAGPTVSAGTPTATVPARDLAQAV